MTDSAFPTEYAEIAKKLDAIDPLQYGKTRNYINGAVTYLSPYLSRGVLSLPQVLDLALSKGQSPNHIQKFIQELAWREYYQRLWQVKGDAIFSDLKQPQADVLHQEMIMGVLDAVTGIEAIDAGIRQLYTGGYMHNHMRMYVASLVCNIGKADWRLPSKWMYYHLLDGDVASNTCSWQWVAGAFSSKKYFCNQENINKYMFTQQVGSFLDCGYGALDAIPVPASLQLTSALELKTKLPTTSLPLIDRTKATLLYNSYNLDPFWRKNEDANRVLLLEPSHFARYPVSARVLDFVLALTVNIKKIQVYVGELHELIDGCAIDANTLFSKEHPSSMHYSGTKESRDWMFPDVTGYFPSFFGYWKQVEKALALS